MEYWAKPPLARGQMVLFATRLDEVLAAGHPARMLGRDPGADRLVAVGGGV